VPPLSNGVRNHSGRFLPFVATRHWHLWRLGGSLHGHGPQTGGRMPVTILRRFRAFPCRRFATPTGGQPPPATRGPGRPSCNQGGQTEVRRREVPSPAFVLVLVDHLQCISLAPMFRTVSSKRRFHLAMADAVIDGMQGQHRTSSRITTLRPRGAPIVTFQRHRQAKAFTPRTREAPRSHRRN